MNKAKMARVAVVGRPAKKAAGSSGGSWNAAPTGTARTAEIPVRFLFATRGGGLLVFGLILLSSSTWFAAVHYVDASSTAPIPPYISWETAATMIQNAVDVSSAGDEIIVTNGVYGTGGRAVFGMLTNRGALYKPITVRSVNGPQFTVIQGRQLPGTITGDGAVRCVYLTNGANLFGFTLTNGATRNSGDFFEIVGGGFLAPLDSAIIVSNCVIAGNSAASQGGGAYTGGRIIRCTFSGNSAILGGGLYGGSLRVVGAV